METIYNKNDIEKKLLRNKEYHEKALKAWESVTYNTKKNGSDFKILSKNFNNLKIEETSYNSYRLKVYFLTELQGYCDDCIYTTVGSLSVSDVKQYINNAMLSHKKQIKEYEEQLGNLNFYFTIFDEEVQNIKKMLSIDDLKSDQYASNALGYALINYIKTKLY